MGEYGVRIQNLEAATIYEVNHGLREKMDSTKAMLTNSLFLDFLLSNGLKVKKDATRDIIGLSFDYGTRTYEEHMSSLKVLSKKYKQDGDIEARARVVGYMINAHKNKNRYEKITKEQLRHDFYTNGIDITYTTYNKKGEVTQEQTIHYVYLFRSTGKAKKGTCMFIREGLYNKAHKFLTMGIKIPKQNAPLVELSAYQSLISSGIIDRVKINPKNILILDDVDVKFKTNVVSIETNEDKQCIAKMLNDYELKNTLFDGQALIDSSIFPKWADGYVLLRHHFMKAAAFNTNIQLFFKDYFGDRYQEAIVYDMFGNAHYAKDIELITTNNAMKWLKFNVSYEYWCDKVYDNGCMFGIVKTSHKSKFGEVQRMSYQMVNALDINTIDKVVEKSVDYIQRLKTDIDTFLDYLERNKNFSNDYEVLTALYNQNPEFARSEYFRARRKKAIETYVLNFKSGRIIQDADNLTIVGSPYAMLLHSVGENVELDTTLRREAGTIQCYTERFDDDEYLAEFRNPFNSRNNLGYLHNIHSDTMRRYFNLGELCIAINMIGTDFQDRNNGSDQDSDSIYVTAQPDIVSHAKYCYENYPTIVNNIPKETNSYNNTMDDYYEIDNNLAHSQLAIGESSNLAQIALTYTYNFDDQKYVDYVCILSVLAQAAIDSAKRRFDIDLNGEIKRIKKDMDISTHKYPLFWLSIRKGYPKDKINKKLICPMNYLSSLKLNKYRDPQSTLPMEHFFCSYELEKERKVCKKVERLIEKYAWDLYGYNTSEDSNDDEYLLLREDFGEMINDIRQVYLSNTYTGLMSWLIDRAFCISAGTRRMSGVSNNVTNTNKSILMKTLYTINKRNFLKIWSKNA